MRRTLMMTMLAAGVLAGAAAGAARAEGMHHGEHGAWGHGYLGLLQGVTLNSEQKTQVHAIVHGAMESMRPQMTQLRALHEQMASELVSAGSVSPATLAAQLQQVETLRAQMDQARLSAALDVRKVLTADQLSQAASMHAQLATLHQQERAVMEQGGAATP